MKLALKLLLLLFTHTCFAQVHQGFRWVGNDNSVYSIENETGFLIKNSFIGAKSQLGSIQNWKLLKEELPEDYDINTYYHSDSLLITIPGTGHLYALNIPELRLKRLDKTYFRGYNFNASQFIRNDTLYSIGGQGFWNQHSLITFYNAKANEWDYYKSLNENKHPSNFKFSGYSKVNDVFFSADLNMDSVLNEKDIHFMLYNFKTRDWEVKGLISKDLKDFGINNYRSLWTGKYLFLFPSTNLGYILILNPVENQLYKFSDLDNHFFLVNAELFYRNGYIYSGSLINSGKNEKAYFDSLSVASLIKKSIKVGVVYESRFSNRIYLLIFLSLIIITVLFYYMFKKHYFRNIPMDLSEVEKKILNVLIQKHPSNRLTSLELNTIAAIDAKSFDNQRQIRYRLIGSINQKLFLYFKTFEFIRRSPNLEDKRTADYFISPEIKENDLEKIKKYLQNI